MPSRRLRPSPRSLGLVAALCLVPALAARSQENPPTAKRPAIYDTQADGTQQIAEALKLAKRDNKRVLLQFGANWCVWCHRMHGVLAENKPIAKTMQYEYELVLIDVDDVNGKRHNDAVDAKYGRPTKHGLPVWVILDAAGRQLTTIKTEPFEAGKDYDVEKIHGALKQWKAKARSADAALLNALSRAKSESKKVFVHFSAPWCGWCKKMDAFLHRDEIASAFTSAFIPVKIDQERMTGGFELKDKYGATEEDGIPFWVVLDADGKKLADARGPEGSVGFPAEPHEIEHFMKVMRTHGENLTAPQLASIEAGLAAKN